ncbi:TPA: hypothetical protein ACSTLU_003584 [Serratia fonticola]|uniref:Uncharacterized protein n=1 Tax=Serratia fonticola TaxID=47917 RepID=A0A448T4F1_SERFO|nr:Uncharacterised protein [Serratia fonticola]
MYYALMLYIMSGDINVDKMVAYYNSKAQCEAAQEQLEYMSTKGLRLKTKCSMMIPDSSHELEPFNQYAIIIASYDGYRALMKPKRIDTRQDMKSCENSIATAKNKVINEPMRYIGICIPEVKK